MATLCPQSSSHPLIVQSFPPLMRAPTHQCLSQSLGPSSVPKILPTLHSSPMPSPHVEVFAYYCHNQGTLHRVSRETEAQGLHTLMCTQALPQPP